MRKVLQTIYFIFIFTGKAKKYNVEQFVKTSHAVRHVEEKGSQFLVTYEDLVNKQTFNKVI